MELRTVAYCQAFPTALDAEETLSHCVKNS